MKPAATVRQLAHDAIAIAPGTRPALWLGIRSAIAVAVPLVLAPTLGPVITTWATLAGFTVALVDKGGAYRTRARALFTTAFGCLLAVALGTVLAQAPDAALVVVPLTCAALAVSQAWGSTAIPVGNTIAVQLILATSLPFHPGDLPLRLAGVALGAAVAITLALVLWPVRVYQPAREAVARTLRLLALHARELATLEVPHDEHVRRHRAIRDALEDARHTLAATRRGRRAESPYGVQLLVLVEGLDQMFGTATVLAEVLYAMRPGARVAFARERAETLTSITARLDALAVSVKSGASPVQVGSTSLVAPNHADDPLDRAAFAQARAQISRLDTTLGLLVRSAAGDQAPVLERMLVERRTITDVLRLAFSRESAVWRHMLRVAVVVFATLALSRAIVLHHAYWVTITALVLLQPYRAATRARGVQRIVGTVLGGVITALIVSTIHDPIVLTVMVVVLAGIGVAVLQLNYALFSLFITPTFILLAELHVRDPSIVEVRIFDTLIGGTLAFVGAFALWPTRERFGELIATALDQAAAHLHEAIGAAVHGAPSPSPAIVSARRTAGLALNNAELSLDRIIAEGATPDAIEPRMALLQFTRRLVAATGALASLRRVVETRQHGPALTEVGAELESALIEIAQSLRRGHPPADRAAPAITIDEPAIAARLQRIELQIRILREAATRLGSDRGAQNGSWWRLAA